MNYPDDLLTYRLLKAANSDSSHERLIKATITDLVYDDVRQKIIKVFAEESTEGDLQNSMSSIKIKAEPSFIQMISIKVITNKRHQMRKGYITRNVIRIKDFPRQNTTKEETSIAKRNLMYEPKQTDNSRKHEKNPLDRNGRVSRCVILYLEACIIGNKTAQKNRTTPTWYMKSSFIMKVMSQVNSNIWCQKLGTVVYSIAVLVRHVWLKQYVNS